jgi:glycosyltransferase involved in cell wall biosynthesis
VHMHGVDFTQYMPFCAVPVLVTVHLPAEYYVPSAFHEGSRALFNAVSSWQRDQLAIGHGVELVTNGIDTERFFPAAEREEFVLALSRVCPEKGLHLALEAAILADVDLLIAGQVYGYAEHQRYFMQEIAPRLDDRRRFIGPVTGAFKQRLLSSAKCVLIPSLVSETSSLVAMEAIACGTPVVAFQNGALPEIVSHQRTGLIVHTAEEMAEAICQVDFIDWRVCREEALQRFSAARMVGNYVQLYNSIAN